MYITSDNTNAMRSDDFADMLNKSDLVSHKLLFSAVSLAIHRSGRRRVPLRPRRLRRCCSSFFACFALEAGIAQILARST